VQKPKSFSVEWTATAQLDLEAVIQYISEQNVAAALKILTELEDSAKTLTRVPFRGRIVPELAEFGIQEYRELIRSPWRIIYRIAGEAAYVLAVLDSRRNLEDLLLDRFTR
jgi:toxin ParE1/3/4